jgi:RHH-type proline utilization regulon transcriptional repressor/proline dehydrogenase/delta 1-pyrroline-5-carboxylate dehydrogenase
VALQDVGYYVAPHVFEIPSIGLLEKEVFGPILHVIRYRAANLRGVVNEINSTGFGLTLGVFSRIEERIDFIATHVRAGNIYINRSMVGATVGVQPFGGEGLSGTGPKAGGAHYLTRFCTERTVSVNTAAIGGNVELIVS